MFLFCETSNNIIVLYIYMYNVYFETSKGKAQKEEREAGKVAETFHMRSKDREQY